MASGTSTAVATGAGSQPLPWGLAGFAAALAASCAGEVSGHVTWDVAAALLFVVGLARGWRHWLDQRSGRIALVLAIGTLGISAALAQDPTEIAVAAARMSGVIVLMLCVALLRPVFADRQLDAALAATLARLPPALRPLAVVLASGAGAVGLSFGAVGVAGATLARRAMPERIAACAAMRGLVLSMLLAPSTASVAAVMAAYPAVSWGAAVAIGAPLALAGAVLAGVLARPIEMEVSPARRGGHLALAAGILLAELAATLAGHLVLGLSMALAISLASAAVAVGCSLFWGRRDLGTTFARVDHELVERWTAIMPETALFLACGLLVGVMQIPELAGAAKSLAAQALPHGLWGVAAILFLVPLITVAGIHPMVPFALLAPIVPAASLGISETGIYAVWIVTFMLSMLLSPISVLTMVTATSFGMPGRGLGLRGNGVYAAMLAAVATLAIAYFCRP